MFDTIEKIVEDILHYLHPTKAAQLRKMTAQNLCYLNCTFGKEIRREYELWDGNPLTEEWCENPNSRTIVNDIDESVNHPHAITFKIIYEVWKRVQK